MKKSIMLLSVLTIISSMTSFATTNFYSSTKSSTTIICPKEIECSKDKSLSSCKAIGDNLEYWGQISTSAHIKKGMYFFYGAEAYYQAPFDNQATPICLYTMRDPDTARYINVRVSAKQGNYLEANPIISTNWQLSGYSANCVNGITTDPQACPFDKVPVIAVTFNSKSYVSLSAYANGILITKNPIGYPSGAISMYEAWDACSDSGQCTVDLIVAPFGATIDIGSIVIDMDNKAKILKVNSDPSTGYDITKSDDLNTIEIKELGTNS